MKHKKNYEVLSEKYRLQGRGQLNKDEVAAYGAARMPATSAAVSKVLEEVKKQLTVEIKSVLDLGAGLGAGAMAAKNVFDEAETFTLIESNHEMLVKGKELVDGNWIQADICKARFTLHDLVVFSYSMGEISSKEWQALLQRAWEAAQVLVVVEPGTPRGFKRILEVRDFLISKGGHLLAPCPHAYTCPLKGGEQWCHFSVRLPRSKEHRLAKGGQLGWEDEKFSYVAFGKEEGKGFFARVIGTVQKPIGHVILPLCTKDGLENRVVSKKEGDRYKQARKTYWGDVVD